MNDSTLVDSLIQAQSHANQISGWAIFFILLGVVILISLLGLYLLRKRKNDIIDEIEFSSNYREKLVEYLESQGQDMNAYSWLIDRSVKMQRMMGSYGKISYITPYQQYKVNNQDIVISFVPQIKKEFENELNSIAPSFETISFYTNPL